MKPSSSPTPPREYSAHSDDVDAAVAELMGTDKDRLEKLLDLAEKAYTDAYCGIDSKALKAMRDYCEPGMVMRLFSLIESGQLQRLSVERELCVQSETATPSEAARANCIYPRCREAPSSADTEITGSFAPYALPKVMDPEGRFSTLNGMQVDTPATRLALDLCRDLYKHANQARVAPLVFAQKITETVNEALRLRAMRSAKTAITPDFVMGRLENDLAQALHGLPEIWRSGFKARFEALMRKAIQIASADSGGLLR